MPLDIPMEVSDQQDSRSSGNDSTASTLISSNRRFIAMLEDSKIKLAAKGDRDSVGQLHNAVESLRSLQQLNISESAGTSSAMVVKKWQGEIGSVALQNIRNIHSLVGDVQSSQSVDQNEVSRLDDCLARAGLYEAISGHYEEKGAARSMVASESDE